MIGCIIQARMGSSRLPGKTLMKLDTNYSTLDYVINQLKHSKFIEKIIVATTKLAQDDIIEKTLETKKIDCFRGSPEDVLDRYYECAKQFRINKIVRITADCPLIDPILVDQVIQKFESEECDYATNTLIRTFPIGTDVEIFSFKTLEKTWMTATLPSEREHVTPFVRKKESKFNIINIKNDMDLSNLRWTLDRKEDLELITKIISKINKNPILMSDILDLFSSEPELKKINMNIDQNEGMLKSLKNDEKFRKLND
tara:strand:+ start:880 stop:1647 length:768 start_codon:yes stop_codon:yes gene_type:complete